MHANSELIKKISRIKKFFLSCDAKGRGLCSKRVLVVNTGSYLILNLKRFKNVNGYLEKIPNNILFENKLVSEVFSHDKGSKPGGVDALLAWLMATTPQLRELVASWEVWGWATRWYMALISCVGHPRMNYEIYDAPKNFYG